jgi:pimeloyl-ACP methyl ester carboxylesterase
MALKTVPMAAPVIIAALLALVKSMIFSGAITRLNIKSRLLLRMGRILNPVLPYMALYRLLAQILMPKKNHKNSRMLFINEAKSLMNNEFKRWFKLTARLTKYLNHLQSQEVQTKGLYVMGSEDHLFLAPAREIVERNENFILEVVPNCGHVVNVERAEAFNRVSIAFIHDLSR